jgi:hypothetical protein
MNNDSNPDPFSQNLPSDNISMSPLDDDDNPRRRLMMLIFSTAAVLGCCVLFVGAFFYFQPDQLSLIKQYFPSATPTVTPSITPSPTLPATPTPNLTATAVIVQATDTAAAYLATATNAESQWSVVLKDTFDSNKNNWYIKPTDDAYAKTAYEIKNGKYTWDTTAKQGVINQISINDRALGDFYLSADIKEVSGPNSADYGVTFREDDNSNFYYFGVDERGEYGFSLYNKDWSTLINWTSSDLIQPGEVNRITVIGQGSHFTFFINNQYLTEMTDDTLKNGTTALAIEEANKDDYAVFEFDNVVLNTPK